MYSPPPTDFDNSKRAFGNRLEVSRRGGSCRTGKASECRYRGQPRAVSSGGFSDRRPWICRTAVVPSTGMSACLIDEHQQRSYEAFQQGLSVAKVRIQLQK